MQFTYEVKGEMYLYKGPRGHGGIAYSVEQIRQNLSRTYGESGFSLVPLKQTTSATSA